MLLIFIVLTVLCAFATGMLVQEYQVNLRMGVQKPEQAPMIGSAFITGILFVVVVVLA